MMIRKTSASSGHLVLACLFVLVAFALSGCAQFDSRLKTAYDIHTATTQSVTSALDAQLISSDDAIAFRDIAVNARFVLDSARAVKDTDIESAEGKLKLAEQILLELQAYLQKREEK